MSPEAKIGWQRVKIPCVGKEWCVWNRIWEIRQCDGGWWGDKGIKNKEKVEIRPRVSKLKIRVLGFPLSELRSHCKILIIREVTWSVFYFRKTYLFSFRLKHCWLPFSRYSTNQSPYWLYKPTAPRSHISLVSLLLIDNSSSGGRGGSDYNSLYSITTSTVDL